MPAATTRKKDGTKVPRLFNDDPHVPLLLYLWRYFDTTDLRRCLPERFRTHRTAQDYVKRWRAAGFIKSAAPGWQHQQHLHSVTPATVAFLNRHYRYHFPATADGTIKPFTIEHERAISHFQTDIYRAVKDRSDLAVPLWLRRFGVDQNSTLIYQDAAGEGERLLKPDLAFLLTRQLPGGRTRPLMHFVEIDRGTESMTAVTGKLAKYLAWYAGPGREQLARWYAPYGEGPPTFRLLVVTAHRDEAGDDARQLARWYTQALLLKPHLPVFVTSSAALSDVRFGRSGRIWRPLFRFRREWLAELDGLDRMNQAYDYVAEKLIELEPHYTLLPPPVLRRLNSHSH